MPVQLRVFPYRAEIPYIHSVLDADDVAVVLDNEEVVPRAYLPNPFPKLPTPYKMLWTYMCPNGINSVLNITDVYDYILPMPDEIIEKAWSAIA